MRLKIILISVIALVVICPVSILLYNVVAGTPPSLTLFNPTVEYLFTVTVNGVTIPGTPGTTITHISWNWGDGSGDEQWFPATHVYPDFGDYPIIVTSHQSDGLSTTKTTSVLLTPPEPSPPTSGEGTVWNVATMVNRWGSDPTKQFLLTQDVMPPIPVQQRIGIYNGASGSYDATDEDVIYLLPTEARSVELEKVLDEYGYPKTSENLALIDDMGTPEDILQHFSNIWGLKPRSEKNDLRHQWFDYWDNFFYNYAFDMYNLVGNLIPETGYNLDLHIPLIIKVWHQLTIAVSPAGWGTTSPFEGDYWCGEGSPVSVSAYENPGYEFDHWDLDGGNVGSTNPYTVTMNAPHTLTAIFFQQPIVTITGHLYYVDNENNQKPVDRALVELYDEDSILHDLVDSTYTTSEGHFTFGPVENIDDELGESGTRDLYIRVYACASDSIAKVGESWDPNTGELIPYEFHTSTVWDVPHGQHDWGNMLVPEEQYPIFFILSTTTKGYDYVHSLVESFAFSVNVFWYQGYEGPFSSGRSAYYPPNDTIHLSGTDTNPDQWDDGIILHEYGHFVADKLDIVDDWFPPGGPHEWSGVYTPELAWSEGWAHFFSFVARGSHTYRNTYAYGIWTEYNAENGIESNDLGEEKNGNALGGSCEASVAGILWDIYDSLSMRDDQDGDGVGDNLDDKENEIWDVVQHYSTGGLLPHKIYTIFDFWDGWFAQGHGYDQEMWDVYYEHGETMSSALSLCAQSPVNVMITDPYGRRVGYLPEYDIVVNEIPGAFYSGPQAEPEEIAIPHPILGVYVTTISGTGSGEFNITMTSATSNGSRIDLETWVDTITLDEVRHDPVALENEGNLAPSLRDIGINELVPSKIIVGQAYPVDINLTIENQGSHLETFNVTVTADSEIVWTQAMSLESGAATTVMFVWDTTGFDEAYYVLGAYVTPLVGEIDTTDNTHTYGSLLVTVPGDVNGDRVVDLFDAATISAHWYPGPPIGPLGYDPKADINNDGNVDIFDSSIVNTHWGQTW